MPYPMSAARGGLGQGGAGDRYYAKMLAAAPTFLVGYWPLSEPSGSVVNDYSGQANNGAYSGVTLAQPGIGDGRNCPLFDGVNDYVNIYSSALNSDFNPAEFAIMLWFRPSSAGVWTDATTRRLIRFSADGSNIANIVRSATNNTLQFGYTAGGTAKTINTTALGGSAIFNCIALTVSKAGDAVKAWVNGAQVGTTQTGLGTWSGALASTAAVIGINSTALANPWDGYIAHVALWSGVGAPAAVEALLPSLAVL